jgi:SAM-dependent methyltransferase
MLPEQLQPHKAYKVGERLDMLEAYRRDLDFWGNGERGLYKIVTKSLADFLVKNVSAVRDNTMVFWCDIGCGAGYFLEGMSESLRNADPVKGPILIPSGVDISPEALARCRRIFNLDNEFVEANLDQHPIVGGSILPWVNADVVSFIDTLQYFKNYRRTFNEIYAGLRPGTVIVVADGMGRSNLRNYPNSLDTCALIGGWVDYSTPVTPRDVTKPGSKNRHLAYRVYRKML